MFTTLYCFQFLCFCWVASYILTRCVLLSHIVHRMIYTLLLCYIFQYIFWLTLFSVVRLPFLNHSNDFLSQSVSLFQKNLPWSTDPLFILNFYGSYSVLLEVKFAALNVYVSSLKLLLSVISITRASILKVCSLRHLLPIFTLHL